MPGPTDQKTVINLFGSVPIFVNLGKKYVQTLAASASERTFKAGDVIVKQGDVGLGFFVVADGQVSVEKSGKVVATLGPGQFFGEMALLDEQPRTANVKAVTPVRCYVLAPWEFWGSVKQDPEALRTLLRETVKRLRHSPPAPED